MPRIANLCISFVAGMSPYHVMLGNKTSEVITSDTKVREIIQIIIEREGCDARLLFSGKLMKEEVTRLNKKQTQKKKELKINKNK